MITLRILQYRADLQDGHVHDDVVSAWTKLFNWNTPPYSHSEIEFSDGMCFSSTARKHKGKTFCGTRFEDVFIVMRNPKRWDVYEKKIDNARERFMYARAKSIGGHKYAFVGIFFDFLLPFGLISKLFLSKQRWYCSQAVYYVLTGKRKRISPRRLTKYILKNGFKLVKGQT